MRIVVIVLLLMVHIVIIGQTRTQVQFGKVNISEFNVQSSIIDTSTPAVVLSDIGISEFEGNSNGNFTLVFKHHKRILIKNRKGFDAATIFISLYNGENSAATEKLEDFEAYTYNIEKDKVVETRSKKDGLILEKVNKERSLRKFTFSNVNEGCIIEFRYKVKSPFYNRLRSWNFQSEYPILWSEYKVVIPPIFDYISSSYGYLDYAVNEMTYLPKTYTIRDPINKTMDNNIITVSGEALVNVWAVKEAPAFQQEAFVYSNLNHIKRIQFQLKSINYSATSSTKVIKNWVETAKDLQTDTDFGAQIEEENSWLNNVINQLNKPDELIAGKNIYEFIRDKFSCTDYDSKWLSQPLKKTFETKTGTAADLNMLLVATLRKAGFSAAPVIVCTRENGFINQNYALPAQYNYTLCRVKLNDKYYLLDASQRKLGFGDIPGYCFNGIARVIDNTALPISLTPDLLQENKKVSIKVKNNEDKSINVFIKIVYGKHESFVLRNKLSTVKESDFVKQITASLPIEYKLKSFVFDSLDKYEQPVQLEIVMNYNFEPDASIFYFNPIILNEWTKNPFISLSRNYPVELPYKFTESYQIEMDIPAGFKVEEMPVSFKLYFNSSDIKFEYQTKSDKHNISIVNTLIASRVLFQKSEYETLRTFFTNVVKKNAEQLVFKRTD